MPITCKLCPNTEELEHVETSHGTTMLCSACIDKLKESLFGATQEDDGSGMCCCKHHVEAMLCRTKAWRKRTSVVPKGHGAVFGEPLRGCRAVYCPGCKAHQHEGMTQEE